ncbi:MAG: hypothetical protein KF889_18635 [Alphaproteobacteria bacterium]|nr:hypothetical protein [Alphaproteobacteria bacterium]MCW5743914.1 hypothetical protein [Alphaproteobacteria bacterium]
MLSTVLQRLNRAAIGLPAGAFVASLDESLNCLTLHVRAGIDMEAARRDARRALSLAGVETAVQVQSHTLRSVASPRSIEHWLKMFATGTVVFDPTLVAQRAQALLDAARACRRELGKRVTGVYFHPGQRVMYVVIPSATDQAGALECQRRLLGSIGKGGPFALRVTSKVPRGDLTAVDSASAPLHRRLAHFIRRAMVPGAVAVALASLAVPAAANTAHRASSPLDVAVGATKNGPTDRYGMLRGLSVFSDGQSLSGNGTFATAGLASFFGEESKPSANPIIRLAQVRRPTVIIRDADPNSPDTAGDVTGAGAGDGPATAGS